ncbi:efflux RND transporter periplasmic adaptor subunit [Nonomuraea sp. NPDC050536]|uniref:efflux RND transporter periplasmic adaptor subunit n=1 Tax=Nonomuraea sp. NPDC050536 TaxID=3364366 RepID=UPI0037CC063E
MKGVIVALETTAIGAAVTAGGVFAAGAFFHDGPHAAKAAAPATHPPATATAAITRGDLIDQESVDGKLTFADGRTIKAGQAGTVTGLPSEGGVVTRGQALYRVDRKPQLLLYGELPAYRDLEDGVKKGPDVEQLERNLRALGFGKGVTVDGRFTAATARAVRRWQKHNGLERTGRVGAGQVVFLPGAARVSATSVEVGDRVAPQRPVLEVTTTERLVRIDLDADKQDVARAGRKVTVKLAEGRPVTGTISKVAKVAKLVKSNGQDKGQAVVQVEIKVPAKAVGALDEAPVTVELRRQRARNVLSVPVEALLALPQGGYGVELADGRRVPVTTGAFGSGRVEVSGQGIAEGMRVAVAGR